MSDRCSGNQDQFISMDGKSFAWQRGFAAFNVSASNKAAVGRYIRTQDAHHKKMDYKSELIALLQKHGVPYGPKYVFD
jgi:putative transposase